MKNYDLTLRRLIIIHFFFNYDFIEFFKKLQTEQKGKNTKICCYMLLKYKKKKNKKVIVLSLTI